MAEIKRIVVVYANKVEKVGYVETLETIGEGKTAMIDARDWLDFEIKSKEAKQEKKVD